MLCFTSNRSSSWVRFCNIHLIRKAQDVSALQVYIVVLGPLHGTNFWRVLQLWAHINVEIPFNWPRELLVYSSVLTAKVGSGWDQVAWTVFFRRQQCQSAFGILTLMLCQKHRTKFQRVSYNPLAYRLSVIWSWLLASQFFSGGHLNNYI